MVSATNSMIVRNMRLIATTAFKGTMSPLQAAIMLALAHKIQHSIDRGVVLDRAEVVRRIGLTRARVTRLLDLTLLAPDIQEEILFTESVDGSELFTERRLRQLTRDSA